MIMKQKLMTFASLALAGTAVGPVAMEAILGKDRLDVIVE